MNRVSKRKNISSYKTKDSSEIRELIHPTHNGNRNQSVAEARITSGCKTIAHYHRTSEEIYITIEGSGNLFIQKEQDQIIQEIELHPGTSVAILQGETHWLENTGKGDLVILCCCSPPYSHEDTFLS